MNKISKLYQKAVRVQVVVCGLLFSIFSFVYLYVFQQDVLEALHFSLAHGKTHFSPIGSALVMTLTLLLLNWGVNALVRLRGKNRSLAYLPSFFVLMAMTNVDHDVYMNGGNTVWLWLLPLLIAGFTGIAFGLKKIARLKVNTTTTIWGLLGCNLFYLLVGSVLTVSVGNNDTNFHHELQLERFLRNKDFTQAAKVGQHSLEASRTLTALRSLALSNMGQMGEKLFTYPQYYGADGLFLSTDSLSILRYTNDSIYKHLGNRPYSGGDNLIYLSNLCYEDRGRFTALDYYLSALLLEKQVDKFAEEICNFYELGDSLPIHYKEAILIYQSTHKEYPFAVDDSLLMNKFMSYSSKRSQFKSKIEEKNQMRREYGDTYWWYFHYQEKNTHRK